MAVKEGNKINVNGKYFECKDKINIIFTNGEIIENVFISKIEDEYIYIFMQQGEARAKIKGIKDIVKIIENVEFKVHPQTIYNAPGVK